MKKDLNPIAIPQDYAEKCITNKPLKNLTFGKQKIIISDEELIKLENYNSNCYEQICIYP